MPFEPFECYAAPAANEGTQSSVAIARVAIVGINSLFELGRAHDKSRGFGNGKFFQKPSADVERLLMTSTDLLSEEPNPTESNQTGSRIGRRTVCAACGQAGTGVDGTAANGRYKSPSQTLASKLRDKRCCIMSGITLSRS